MNERESIRAKIPVLPDWCDNAVVGKKADADDSTFARTAKATGMPRYPLIVVEVRPAAAGTANILRDALASSMVLIFASRTFSLRDAIISRRRACFQLDFEIVNLPLARNFFIRRQDALKHTRRRLLLRTQHMVGGFP